MRPTQIVAAVLSLSTLSAAWPEALGEIRAVQNVHALLYGRQESSDSAEPTTTAAPRSTAASRASSGAAPSTEESSARRTTTARESDRPTDSDESTTAKITGSVTPTGTRTGSRNNTRTSFGNHVQAGGIQMITPGIFDTMQYYRIGDWVEFAWNYTSLKVTPTAIDILASCSANQGTFTIAVNQSVEETGRVYWDTQAYKDSGKNPQLLTNMYTLIIYDADSSVSARPKPGYLQTFQMHQFGMYEPRKYVPWDEFQCVGCNSALSSHELSVLRIFAITGTTMLTSFLFFTYNFGLW